MPSSLYFSRAPLAGVGKLFFLKVPQLAPEGSAVRRLLGSYVNEIDSGLLSSKHAPGLNHSSVPEYLLTSMKALPGYAGQELVLEAGLAGVRQKVKVEVSAGGSAKGSFPGAPVSLGIEIDYSKVRSVEIDFGEGSTKFYIPRDLIRDAYVEFARNSSKYNRVMFNNDRMLVDQILLVRNMSLNVESQSEFGADFEAKATAVSGMEAGVKYSRKSSREFQIKITDGRDYLFAVGAIQADKFAD